MALNEEVAEDLQRCIAKTDLGSLVAGPSAEDKAILLELLENQHATMQVLAAMNGIEWRPKALRRLLDPQ